MRDVSQRAEGLGFESLWVIDHSLPSPVYHQTWFDPVLTLTYIAGHTQRIKLGTGILVAVLRNPVVLAKEIATLQFFSNNRSIAGIGAGWNQLDFDAVQVPREERGARTDEIIEILNLLLAKPSASYEGRHYRFPELAIEPLPPVHTPIWIGGGRQPALQGSSEQRSETAPSVIRRIARADGWIAMAQHSGEMLREDRQRIETEARRIGRDPRAITFAQINYVHVVDTDDREKAYDEQRHVFAQYMGPGRPWSYVQACYLVGSVTDIVNRLRDRLSTGITHMIFGPVTIQPGELERQLDLITTRVIPQVGGA